MDEPVKKSLRQRLEQEYCEGYAKHYRKKHVSTGQHGKNILMEMSRGRAGRNAWFLRYNHGKYSLRIYAGRNAVWAVFFLRFGQKTGLIRNLNVRRKCAHSFIAAQQSGKTCLTSVLMGSGEPLDKL